MKFYFFIDYDDASDKLRPFQLEVIRRKLNGISDLISEFVAYNRVNPKVGMEFELHETKKNKKKKKIQ